MSAASPISALLRDLIIFRQTLVCVLTITEPNIILRIIDVTENLALNAKFRHEKINAPGVYFRKYGKSYNKCFSPLASHENHFYV